MSEKLVSSEQSLESEKDSEIQELRRGKVQALQVLQVRNLINDICVVKVS